MTDLKQLLACRVLSENVIEFSCLLYAPPSVRSGAEVSSLYCCPGVGVGGTASVSQFSGLGSPGDRRGSQHPKEGDRRRLMPTDLCRAFLLAPPALLRCPVPRLAQGSSAGLCLKGGLGEA